MLRYVILLSDGSLGSTSRGVVVSHNVDAAYDWLRRLKGDMIVVVI